MKTFYKTHISCHPFQKAKQPKSKKLGQIFRTKTPPSLSILRKSNAFCTILPFQIARRSSFSSPQIHAKSSKKPLFKAAFSPKTRLFSIKSHDKTLQFQCINMHLRTPFTPCNPAFWCILPCVLVHFALRLAPFCLAFSSKTHCIQWHFALHLAAFCIAFWCKWQVTPQILHIDVIQNGIAYICMQPHSVSKTTRARID